MTEDEAKINWCPMTRYREVKKRDLPGYHSISNLPTAQGRCIASGCMAWREDEVMADRGYCGLAGKL